MTTIALFPGAPYRGVRRSALAAAAERLKSVADQLAGLLPTSTKQLVDTTHVLARNATVRRFFASCDRRAEAGLEIVPWIRAQSGLKRLPVVGYWIVLNQKPDVRAA